MRGLLFQDLRLDLERGRDEADLLLDDDFVAAIIEDRDLLDRREAGGHLLRIGDKVPHFLHRGRDRKRFLDSHSLIQRKNREAQLYASFRWSIRMPRSGGRGWEYAAPGFRHSRRAIPVEWMRQIKVQRSGEASRVQ